MSSTNKIEEEQPDEAFDMFDDLADEDDSEPEQPDSALQVEESRPPQAE